MSAKIVVQHVGRPYGPCDPIPETAWIHMSTHASIPAAARAIMRAESHCPPGSWNDHYRIMRGNSRIELCCVCGGLGWLPDGPNGRREKCICCHAGEARPETAEELEIANRLDEMRTSDDDDEYEPPAYNRDQ